MMTTSYDYCLVNLLNKRSKNMKNKISVNSGKKWWQSKTLWAAALEIALGIGAIVMQQYEAGTTLTITGIATAYLRLKTSMEIVQ